MPKPAPDQAGAEAFGRRLVSLLENSGQRRHGAGGYLAKKYKVSPVTANAWLNGTHKAEPELARRIAEDHGDTFDWLYFGVEAPANRVGELRAEYAWELPPDIFDGGGGEWADVPGASQSAALGDGALPDDYAEAHTLKFRRRSLEKKGLKPRSLQVYYGTGDSMEPRIHDGDAILFDTSDTRIVDGRIYVIRYDGHVFAKRLQVHDDLVFIESDNKHDPKWRRPVLVREGDDFEVIGRVRWIGSWED